MKEGSMEKASPDRYSLKYVQITTGTNFVPTITIGLMTDGEMVERAAWGKGPVDAACKAIDGITGVRAELKEYSIVSETGGKDARGKAEVKVGCNGQVVTGKGVSTDIIEASVFAYLDAVNQILEKELS